MAPTTNGAAPTSTGAGTHRDVTLKLPQLQNLCKRDPPGYRSDYDAQIRRLRSECTILSLSPSSKPSHRLVELVQFAAAVSSSSYRGDESDRIARLLIDLLLGQSSSEEGDAASGVASQPMASAAGGSSGKQRSAGIASADASIMSIPNSALVLHRDVRKACVSALILMRNKGAVPPLTLHHLFFRIMSCVPDKNLRELLYRHIVNDVRNVNKKGKRDESVNRSIQSFLHGIVSSPNSSGSSSSSASATVDPDDASSNVAARRAVDMVAELYRRNVWTDARTVSIMASAVQHPDGMVMAKAIRFFLGIEEKMADDKVREEEDEWAGVSEVDLHLHSKKTKSRRRQVMKQVKNRKKAQVQREQDRLADDDTNFDSTSASNNNDRNRNLYPAMELLNDPQGLAESTFRKLRSSASSSSAYKFEVKLLMMNFVTRLVGNHELLLLPLYPYLRRYMGGHQRDVTAVLAYTVQACHEYVPPDEVHGLLRTIAHEFITERCSGEQMAVGINAVRAICARVPSVLSTAEEDGPDGDDNDGGGGGGDGVAMDMEAFVRDLVLYSKHRDRSVSVAAKSWTNFIRETHPSLLAGKDRGKEGSALHRAGERPLRYGERRVAAGVEGAELLVEYEAQKKAAAAAKKKRRGEGEEEEGSDDDDDDEDGIQEEKWNDVESASDAEESGEWVNVENDEDGEGKDGNGEEEAAADSHGDDAVAPDLVLVKEVDGKMVPQDSDARTEVSEDDNVQDVSKLSPEEREALRQKVSSTRVFTASDFEKMRKLVEREERAKRDPRAAARRKRAIAKGRQFEELSDDDSDVDSEDEGLHIKGVVNPGDIMAQAKKKRMSKAERLEKVLEGRQKFEAKGREGGSTNEEKKRKKNFLMSKFSRGTRTKMGGKETFRSAIKNKAGPLGRDAKKRRRKI